MFISNILDQAADRLDNVDWKQLTKKAIKAWDFTFKIIVITMILTYLAGESLGTWVHQTNDWLAHQWVRLIVPPTSVETEQAQIIVEEVSPPTMPAVEVELNLPPPLVIEDPWASPIKVELMLPLALEPLAIMFTMPLLLTAVQAPVALLVAGQEVTQPPAPTKRRRGSAPRSQGNTVTKEVDPALPSRKPRGHKDHSKRVRRTLAA